MALTRTAITVSVVIIVDSSTVNDPDDALTPLETLVKDGIQFGIDSELEVPGIDYDGICQVVDATVTNCVTVD